MKVNLETLKVGDIVLLRNGTICTVSDVEVGGGELDAPYFKITTAHKRVYTGLPDSHSRNTWVHELDGRLCGYTQFERAGDIVAFSAALSVDELYKAREAMETAMEDIEKRDAVNNPSHYQAENGKQLWDTMQDLATNEEYVGYLKLNITKYLYCYRGKGGEESLEKAQAYLKKLIEVEYGNQERWKSE
jgi:hypothetical protein